MAFGAVGAQAISHGRLKPAVAVRADAQLSRHLVDFFEAHTRKFFQQPVRVVLGQSDGRIPHQVKDFDYIIVCKA